MLENHIEKKCKELADFYEIKNVKLFTPSDTGYPDRLFMPKGGIPFFVEFKRASGGVLSKKQRKHLMELQSLGYLAYVCSSVEQFLDILDNYDTSKKDMAALLLSESSRS